MSQPGLCVESFGSNLHPIKGTRVQTSKLNYRPKKCLFAHPETLLAQHKPIQRKPQGKHVYGNHF